jgi:hypothetical protein
VRSAIFQGEFIDEDLKLPEPKGAVVQLEEKVFIPQKEYPDVSSSTLPLSLSPSS